MNDFKFQLYYTTFTVPPEGYTYDLEGKCIVAVSYLSDSSNLYILGDTFIRNFVSSFDYKKEKIFVGVNVNAPSGTTITKKMSPWQIAGIVIACLLGVALIALLVWCLCKCTRKN